MIPTTEQVQAWGKEAGLHASHQTGETGEWYLIRDEKLVALAYAAGAARDVPVEKETPN